MKTKESLGATILAPLFTILLVIIFFVGAILVYLNSNIFNTRKLVSNIKLDELIDDVKDDIIEEGLEDYVGNKRELEDILDVVLEEKFLDEAVIEIWDAEFYGDSKIDRKALEKAFDKATEDFFDENSDKYSSKDAEYLRDEVIDFLEEAIYDTAMEDSNSDERAMVVAVRDYCVKIIYLLLLVSAVLIGLLVILYKNKARVLIFSGIAMTISQTFNLLITFGLSGLIAAIISENIEEEAEEITAFVGAAFQRFTRGAVLFFGGLLVIGILAIILGKVLSKAYNETETLEDFDL